MGIFFPCLSAGSISSLSPAKCDLFWSSSLRHNRAVFVVRRKRRSKGKDRGEGRGGNETRGQNKREEQETGYVRFFFSPPLSSFLSTNCKSLHLALFPLSIPSLFHCLSFSLKVPECTASVASLAGQYTMREMGVKFVCLHAGNGGKRKRQINMVAKERACMQNGTKNRLLFFFFFMNFMVTHNQDLNSDSEVNARKSHHRHKGSVQKCDCHLILLFKKSHSSHVCKMSKLFPDVHVTPRWIAGCRFAA